MSPLPWDLDGQMPASIGHLLEVRAAVHPERLALTYADADGEETSWSYAELWRRSSEVAGTLRALGPPGQRALLLYPPGLQFLAAFCGCSLAGWTPVPTCFPKPGRSMRRLDSIAAACQPSLLLTDAPTAAAVDPNRWHDAAARLPRVPTDGLDGAELAALRDRLPTDVPRVEGLGLLQFTSGSTSEPKGVMVSDANLLANLASICHGFGLTDADFDDAESATAVFWLPAFHDMGLIGGLLTPLYLGGHAVLQSPRDFLARPIRWLAAISRHRAVVTGAPNFAYQLCVDRIDGRQAEPLDLSSLRVAFCGAEPVQPETMERFASRFAHAGFQRRALMPCYGLAEATLYVAGCRPERPRTVLALDRQQLERGVAVPVDDSSGNSAATVRMMACGVVAQQTEVRIVDPDSRQPVPDGRVGEIWVRGAAVARGYWPPAELVAGAAPDPRFEGRLANQPADSPPYCQTGDLGFFWQGELFVTGRTKDLIILRGRNHYPQDIELTVKSVLGDDSATVAAFAVDGPAGEGLTVVGETARKVDPSSLPALTREIRRSIIDQHDVDPRHIVLVRPAAIPVTTSGKVQRSACRQRFVAGELAVRHRWDRHDLQVDGAPLPAPQLPAVLTGDQRESAAEEIERWLVAWLAQRTGVSDDAIDPLVSMDRLGLDSFTSVEMSGAIEDWLGIRLTPEIAYQHPTPRQLSHYLAEQLAEPARGAG
jgi:acyl-CoA synthetase (AMP-forming)/AMP-acid ligase II/acyl carrier protein